MRVALLTLNASDDPRANLAITRRYVNEATDAGADLVMTPEVTNCISTSRAHQQETLRLEDEDETLSELRKIAKSRRIWVLIGSLALKTDDADGRFANRSFMLSPEGEITARYDKIHMFDVKVSAHETYRESASYRPGAHAVLAKTAVGNIGMTICYDLRFAHLYRTLAQAGAEILTVPAAFSPVTGTAHWESLLRARAIETGCYVLAPAQTGLHAENGAANRRTYGHSMAVSPWGEVLYDGGITPGWGLIDVDLAEVKKARTRVPSLANTREFEDPK